MIKTLLNILFLLIGFTTFSQNLFYQDVFYGGVTAGGFSTGQGSGSGSFNLYIEPGSTIKKAYLFTYRYRYPPVVPITINGFPYLFDTTNILMQVSHKSLFVNPVQLYYSDFTDSLNANITSNFNITIPSQIGLPINSGYWTIYIYIAYENPSLPKLTTSLWVNDKDFLGNELYHYNNLSPIDNSQPVSLALYSDRTIDTASTIPNSYNTYLNGNLLGRIGGADASSNLWTYAGVRGHFYYQNNTLFGLDDDTPDSLMRGSDGLADISSYLFNNDTSFNFSFIHELFPNNSPSNTGVNLAEVITYTTPCDTFTTTITQNDTICLGESLQLQATGGVTYSWFSPLTPEGGIMGGLSDTAIANPIATPPQTTTYICTIKNDSGCVKTEQVKIWVNPLPEPSQNVVVNNICGSAVGSLQVGNISSNTAPYSYNLHNIMTQNTITQPNNTFNQLDSGFYLLTINDNNDCSFTDIFEIKEINNVVANFTATPDSGVAPLEVDFENTSVNANGYQWWVTSFPFGFAQGALPDTLTQNSLLNTQYLFEQSGNYEACLITYNNIPRCADTTCKTIVVVDEISFIIPNIFTPNGDNNNDNFVIQITGANLIEELNVEVFNRWGEKIKNAEFSPFDSAQGANSQHLTPNTQYTIWDGRTTAGAICPEGTYFYVLNYTTTAGATETLKGSLTVLR